MKFFRNLNYITLILFFISCESSYDTLNKKNNLYTFTKQNIKKVLQKGKTKGTYHFSYTGRVTWVLEPQFPVNVMIESYNDNDKVIVYKKYKVENSNFFTITEDLKPGKYRIVSRIPDETLENFNKDALGPYIEIKSNGIAEHTDRQLLHERIIIVNAPDWLDIVEGKQPILKWEPVKDAGYYSLYWEEESVTSGKILYRKKIKKMTVTEYKFDFDLENESLKGKKSLVIWEIIAYTKYGLTIAHESKSFRFKY